MQPNIFITGLLPEQHYRFVLATNEALVPQIQAMHNVSENLARQAAGLLLGSFFLCAHSAKSEDRSIGIHLERKSPPERMLAQSKADGEGRISIGEHDPLLEVATLLEDGSILRVTRWQENRKLAFTSLVQVRHHDLGRSLDHFIQQSDQIMSSSRIVLLPSSGIFFEALPEATAADHGAILDLAFELKPDVLLGPLEEGKSWQIKSAFVFVPLHSGRFQLTCDCSADKVHSLVRLMGANEAAQLLSERGKIEIKCEFCQKKYCLSQEDIASIFQS